jgi:hypothetical protein
MNDKCAGVRMNYTAIIYSVTVLIHVWCQFHWLSLKALSIVLGKL